MAGLLGGLGHRDLSTAQNCGYWCEAQPSRRRGSTSSISYQKNNMSIPVNAIQNLPRWKILIELLLFRPALTAQKRRHYYGAYAGATRLFFCNVGCGSQIFNTGAGWARTINMTNTLA